MPDKPRFRVIPGPKPNAMCQNWKCREPRYVELPAHAAEGSILRTRWPCKCGEYHVVVRDMRTP